MYCNRNFVYMTSEHVVIHVIEAVPIGFRKGLGLVIGRVYSPCLSMGQQSAIMDTITAGSLMGILIVLQMAIIRECIRMKGHVNTSSLDLKTEMGNLGNLLDEALDYVADIANGPIASSPVVTQAGADVKELLLTALMNKMMMPLNHGSTQEPQEREIQQDDPPQNAADEI